MNEIRFDIDSHTYWLNDKQLISVTQLLKKHGISRSYDDIDQSVLLAKAKRGALIHKFLENYINTGEKPVFDVVEVDNFAQWVNDNSVDYMQSEQIVYNDLIAGTIDLVGCRDVKVSNIANEWGDRRCGGELFFADFKTSFSLDFDECRWQLSLYCYLYQVGLISVGDSYRGGYNEGHNLIVLHFQRDGSIKEVSLKPIPYKELMELLEKERLRQYKVELIGVESDE